MMRGIHVLEVLIMKNLTFIEKNDGTFMAQVGKRTSYAMTEEIKNNIEALQQKGMSMTINEINAMIIAMNNGTRMYHSTRTNSVENKKHMF